jgi:hypothetical protein
MKKRKIDLPFLDELVTLTKPDRASRPFTHPIKAENSCFLEWAGIKGRCCVGMVMVTKKRLGNSPSWTPAIFANSFLRVILRES